MKSNAALVQSIDQSLPELVDTLRQLVEVPSISSDSGRAEQMQESAELVRSKFAALGFDAVIRSAVAEDGTVGQPAILARRNANHDSVDATTVLLYAHHDVQPLGELDRWTYPPLELTQVGDRLYGRGSADDGIGVVVHLAALEAFGDELPVNVVVFIEGEEEIGSPTFVEFVEKYKEELAADVIVVADSGNWTTDIPAITASLRGVGSCDVKLEVLEHGVHSGMFGGPILDAVTLASRLISTLHDDNGDVAVNGLGGRGNADVVWDEGDFRRDASVVDGYELAGTGDLAARVWTKPAVSVMGFDARPVVESSNTIAPECTFRLSLRTVPGVDSKTSMEALVAHLEEHRPFGARMTITPVEMGPSYIADLEAPATQALKDSLAEAWGTDPVAIGVGASIPFISDFQTAFPEAQVLVTGVEDPQANAHAADESASLSTLRNAAVAEALFLSRLGR